MEATQGEWLITAAWVIREKIAMKTASCLLRVIMCEGSTTEWCLLVIPRWIKHFKDFIQVTSSFAQHVSFLSVSTVSFFAACAKNIKTTLVSCKKKICCHINLKWKTAFQRHFRPCQLSFRCSNMKCDTVAAWQTRWIPKSQRTVRRALWQAGDWLYRITRAG